MAALLERAGNAAELVPTLSETVRAQISENVFRCWQCVKCTSGCPLAEQFDLTPNQVMRALQLDDASVLASRAIWLCASCYPCATRCPRGIDVTAVMDALRIEARRRGVPAAIPEIPVFNSIFMRLTSFFGRVPEALLMGTFNFARRKLMHDADLGWRLLRRGRLKLVPKIVRSPKSAKRLVARENMVGYFPGCASEGSAVDYDRTARAAARALDLELVEPEGWTCCGSSPAHATDATKALLMPMRTLATVESMNLDTLTSPCSSCFARLKAAEHEVRADSAKAALAAEASGHVYAGTVRVQHLLDTFMDRAGIDGIARRVKHPLTGLKVACYYGCLITRPSRITGAEHAEYPMKMDHLMQALGAQPLAWSAKTDCCGGSLGVTHTKASLAMTRRILENARACGADLVVSMCPMCQMNLDARQQLLGFESETPIVYATQLMLLAFGHGERAALLDKALVDSRPVLRAKGLLHAT
jgi:heterodisulfide reductase subunit B